MAAKSRLNSLVGKRVLITAGPTREYLDPVRYLSNASSGTMGIALAMEARRLGAEVSLVLGPVDEGRRELLHAHRRGLRVVPVVSAREMASAVRERAQEAAVFIGAAAVADYRPALYSREKIKKNGVSKSVQLVRNPDIIAEVARRGPHRPPVVIGFALETRDLLKNAQTKLREKGLDWIVANRETTIGSPQGKAVMLSRWGERISLGRTSKARLAQKIWQALLRRPAL